MIIIFTCVDVIRLPYECVPYDVFINIDYYDG